MKRDEERQQGKHTNTIRSENGTIRSGNGTIRPGNRAARICLVLCLAGAAVAGGIFLFQQNTRIRAEERLEQLAEDTGQNPEDGANRSATDSADDPAEVPAGDPAEVPADDPADENEELSAPERKIDFEDLQENVNEDIYAWVYIPDTAIDYPVLQHPTDNVWYLQHNLDGSKGYPGCIYSENYNAKDFTDPDTVLYGHNMKTGTMFAGLHKFRDSEYFEEHPYIYIYTPEGTKVYEIFAAYEYSSAHLLLNFDLEDPEIFQTYLDGILEQRDMTVNLKKEISLTAEDRILTLSTCVSNKPNQRYLVQGVLCNED